MVRIRLPPAKSLRTIGSSAAAVLRSRPDAAALPGRLLPTPAKHVDRAGKHAFRIFLAASRWTGLKLMGPPGIDISPVILILLLVFLRRLLVFDIAPHAL